MLGIKADLRNWPTRVAAINEGRLGIEALEFHLIPSDFEDRELFKQVVWAVGSQLATVKFLSFHYPWQFTERPEWFEEHWPDFTFTVEQLDLLCQMAGPEKATVGIHYQNERPTTEVQEVGIAMLVERKRRALKGTDQLLQEVLARTSRIARIYSQRVLLENNPTIGAQVLGLSDHVAEDFLAYGTLWSESGLGVLVDIAHAAMVQRYYQEFPEPGSGPLKNLEAYREFYAGVPESVAGDWGFALWFRMLSGKLGAVHISGCHSWKKDGEGVVDLDDSTNLINVGSALGNVPTGVPVILERRDSWKDWEGDLRNLGVLRAAA